jgi:hypothetical protein
VLYSVANNSLSKRLVKQVREYLQQHPKEIDHKPESDESRPLVPESVFGISYAKAMVPTELSPPIVTREEDVSLLVDEPDDDEEYYTNLLKDVKPMDIEVVKHPHRLSKKIII